MKKTTISVSTSQIILFFLLIICYSSKSLAQNSLNSLSYYGTGIYNPSDVLGIKGYVANLNTGISYINLDAPYTHSQLSVQYAFPSYRNYVGFHLESKSISTVMSINSLGISFIHSIPINERSSLTLSLEGQYRIDQWRSGNWQFEDGLLSGSTSNEPLIEGSVGQADMRSGILFSSPSLRIGIVGGQLLKPVIYPMFENKEKSAYLWDIELSFQQPLESKSSIQWRNFFRSETVIQQWMSQVLLDVSGYSIGFYSKLSKGVLHTNEHSLGFMTGLQSKSISCLISFGQTIKGLSKQGMRMEILLKYTPKIDNRSRVVWRKVSCPIYW